MESIKRFILVMLVFGAGLSSTCLAWGSFDPPDDIKIERTWTMIAYGESIGMLRGVSQVVRKGGKKLVENKIGGMVGIAEGVQLNSNETVYLGPGGVEIFEAFYQEVNRSDRIVVKAKLIDDIMTFDIIMKEGDPVYSEDFVKDIDYHWSTAYMDVGRQGFQKGHNFEKKILDIYALKSKVVRGSYLGTETLKQGGHQFECHKMTFDYGDVKGTFWMAKDDLGWFLVKEEAETGGVPFQMYLDEYIITKKSTEPSRKEQTTGKDFGF